MIIDCAHYEDGRRIDEGELPLEEAAARSKQGGFVWLGLFEPGIAELNQVRDAFGLHELAVEDALNIHQRPKIERYDENVQLIVLRTARYDDTAEEIEFGEISVFLGPTFVITVRQGVANELRGARQRLEQRQELLAVGSVSALWAILDTVVDSYLPVVAELERDIDQVEATVFAGAAAATERIYKLRREATDFYRAVHPLLAVTGTVARMADGKLRHYLRDVQDHLLQADEEVAAQRDLLGTILEANMAVISVEQTRVSLQQNSTIEQLTILATIFLPLTFVTGFFGQNFGWLVGSIGGWREFVCYGIGGLVVPLVLLYLWLRRSRAPREAPPARPLGVQPPGRDDQCLGVQRGEVGRRPEVGSDPLGVLGHVRRHLVGERITGDVLGGAVHPDDVPADVGHVEPQRDVRVEADVAQLDLGRLAVDEERLVVLEQEPDRDAVRPAVRADRRQPGHQVGPQSPLDVRAAVSRQVRRQLHAAHPGRNRGSAAGPVLPLRADHRGERRHGRVVNRSPAAGDADVAAARPAP